MRLLSLVLVLVHSQAVWLWSNQVPVQAGTNARQPFTRSYFVMGSSQAPLLHGSSANDVSPVERKINFVDAQPLSVGSREENAPGAYSWGYRWVDEVGNQMFREETADGRGTVRGRYSFREATGLLRIVEYIADQYGFRTRIRSNEPGLVTSNPANAEIIKFEDENNIPE